ncbi:MAG TPA: hydroxyacylglutathione hydrolase [Thiomicrospira sp.]|jgi:hydroxyacylglutathione hydrolase|nr:hydroxyacylglutathione hydrolase [Thiomicrospira sp.]
MKIVRLLTNYDNYIWVIEATDGSRKAWVVDPTESLPVIKHFEQYNLKLSGILITHHHYDHTAGVEHLIATLGKVAIISNKRGPFKQVSQHVEEGDFIAVAGEKFKVLSIPGHSQEHLAFYHPKALFCGDVLFTAGCGKSWCQSAKPMAESLLKLRALDDDCWVYCGHEYTYGNINFAAIVEPNNVKIKERQKLVAEKTRAGIPCVPEKLSVEKETNPFLRFDLPELKNTLINKKQQFENFALTDSANFYATLRAWKDSLDKTGELEKGL